MGFGISLQGNICSGKSTLNNYLNGPGRNIIEASLESDESLIVNSEVIDPTLLELFNRCRKERFHFSAIKGISASAERSWLHGRIGKYFAAKYHKGLYVTDRDAIEGLEIFARNTMDEGLLHVTAFEELQRNLKAAIDELGRTTEEQRLWHPQLIVYMRVTDPNILHRRAQIPRTEGGDASKIPLAYLQELNRRYEAHFDDLKRIYANWGLEKPEVYVVDSLTSAYDDPNFLEDTTKEIARRIKNIKESRKGVG